MITTAFELPGYRVVKTIGLVRGVTVRSRSILGTIGASLETLVGGNITLFEEMCEKTREEALELMMQHAAQENANAVIGVRYDATEVCRASPKCSPTARLYRWNVPRDSHRLSWRAHSQRTRIVAFAILEEF
jgi:uncharacterized protein YbjQ (UPF0145 family)